MTCDVYSYKLSKLCYAKIIMNVINNYSTGVPMTVPLQKKTHCIHRDKKEFNSGQNDIDKVKIGLLNTVYYELTITCI